MRQPRPEWSTRACSALLIALAALALSGIPTRAATDDQNLTGTVYLADGTLLSTTPWANNTIFAVYVNHGGDWSTAWRYPAAPSWYITSGGAYSIVLPASEKNISWSDGDPYRMEFDTSEISGVPATIENATSHGTGDAGEVSLAGITENTIVWDATDNFQRWDVVLLARLDLSVASSEVGVVPASPSVGTVVTINATIRNLGSRDAADVTVRFTDGSPPAGTTIEPDAIIPSIAASGSAHTQISWTAGPVGPHHVCASADPDGRILESDETNNVGCIDIVVSGAPPTRPDYVPSQPQPIPPVRTGLSSSVSFSVAVLNQGNASATSTASLAFYNASTPGAPFATFGVSALAPGISSRFTAFWTSPSVPGMYSILADVDYGDDLVEWDETNNRFTWTVDVLAGPVTNLVVGSPNYTTTRTYVTSATPLSFSVIDQSGSGIRFTDYRVDNGTLVNYTTTGAFTLSAEGDRYIEWFSEDFAGNVEPSGVAVLRVDDTPPITTLSPLSGPYSPNTPFTLAAADGGSGVKVTQYRIDGGTWTLYGGTFTVPAGDHAIGYRSVDHVNNAETERTQVVRVQAESPLPTPNWKPLVAALFAGVLAIVGVMTARRAPWPTGSRRRLRAFVLVALPFVAAEATTGIVSLLTGLLSIPPLFGAGTAVDLTILIAGILVSAYRVRAGRPPSR